MEDKVVLITGALGLIGREISKSFLKDGFKVIVSDLDISKQDIFFKEILALNIDIANLMIIKLDITDQNSIDDVLVKSVEKFKTIDVLVNNAAIDAKFDTANLQKLSSCRFEDYPFELIEESVRVNMLGTIRMTQNVCKIMLAQGFGNIINVASIYAILAPNQSLYDWGQDRELFRFKPVDYLVSKSFIPNFTRYIATLYGSNNIRCNAIAPHGIFNNHDQNFLTNFKKLSPLGRMCDVTDLYGAFRYLASNESNYTTGSTMVIDGGWSSW